MNQKFSLKYGIILAASLTLFFLTMWLMGQADKTWLRVFNGVIHLVVLYIAILKFRRARPETYGNYLSGVGLGLTTSVIGSFLFGGFIALFTALNPAFQESLSSAIPYNSSLIPLSAALFVIVEGIAAGLVGSYLITRIINAQLLKEKTGNIDFNDEYARNAEFTAYKQS